MIGTPVSKQLVGGGALRAQLTIAGNSTRNPSCSVAFTSREGAAVDAVIFDKSSERWVKFTPVGDVTFTSDKREASRIDPRQLKAYIRDYELAYLEDSLTAEPADGDQKPS